MSLQLLNKALFKQIENLRDCRSADALQEEISRANAMSNVARQIIDNGKLVLEAEKLHIEHGYGNQSKALQALLTTE